MVSKAVGVDSCNGAMTPDGKRTWVQSAQTERGSKVLMVGDGINDGPALACAHVGVAMASGGTALAIQNADAALLTDDLDGITSLIELSLACRRTIWTNIVAAMLIKVRLPELERLSCRDRCPYHNVGVFGTDPTDN